jgi:hypothetical protein
MNKDRPASKLKLGHARESHCAPSHLGQHGVASHEAQQHGGARRRGRHGSQQPEHMRAQWSNDAGGSSKVDTAAVTGAVDWNLSKLL